MKFEELLSRVPQHLRAEFQTFTETGDASDEFFAFLDEDPEAQEAVDIVFASQAQTLEDLASSLRATEPAPAHAAAMISLTPDAVASDLSRALAGAASLSEQDRRATIAKAVDGVPALAPEASAGLLRRTVADIAEAVDP